MQVEAKFDRDLIWYRGDSVRYLAVRVFAPGDGVKKQTAPLNLGLVVDASGSMAGEPLRFAIDAAQRVVANLTANDRLSIVSFESEVTDHLKGEEMSESGRQRAMEALQGIRTKGNTNLSGGWLRGAEHVAVEMASHPGLLNRVIVLSDGFANKGIVDPAQLATHAEQLALRGLVSSTVGIGDDYHSETLEAIAVKGGGSHHRAARPQEIVEVVTAELDEIRITEGENVRILLRHAPGITIKSLNDFPLVRTDEGLICDLGSLAARTSRVAIFSVKFPAGQPGLHCPIEVDVKWRRPGEREVLWAQPLTVSARFATGSDNNNQAFDAALTDEVAQMWQAKIVRRVVRLNREGRFIDSIKRLDQDLPRFSRYAERAANGSSLVAELQRLREVANHAWSEGSRKEIEIAMHKRAYRKPDARSQQPTPWSDILPNR